MRVAVFVKQVPDPWRMPTLTTRGTVDRQALPGLMNECDQHALEAGLRLTEEHGGDVTVVTMGPASAADILGQALSMGADSAIHLQDDALAGSDAITTSLALAAVVRDQGFDLLVFGTASTDAGMAMVPAMMAERLEMTQLTMAYSVEVAGDRVRIQRAAESGSITVEGHLPAVLSIAVGANDPRFPSFRGIKAARTKPVHTISVDDIGLDPAAVGSRGSFTTVIDAEARPRKANRTVVAASPRSGADIADYLAAQGFLPRGASDQERGSS